MAAILFICQRVSCLQISSQMNEILSVNVEIECMYPDSRVFQYWIFLKYPIDMCYVTRNLQVVELA